MMGDVAFLTRACALLKHKLGSVLFNIGPRKVGSVCRIALFEKIWAAPFRFWSHDPLFLLAAFLSLLAYQLLSIWPEFGILTWWVPTSTLINEQVIASSCEYSKEMGKPTAYYLN